MLPELGHEEVVLIGYSRTLLAALADKLRPGSVLVVEEPTVAASRNVVALAGRNRVVSRVLLWEYQDLSSIGALVESDPAVRGARAVVPGIEYAVEPGRVPSVVAWLPRRWAGCRRGLPQQGPAAARCRDCRTAQPGLRRCAQRGRGARLLRPGADAVRPQTDGSPG